MVDKESEVNVFTRSRYCFRNWSPKGAKEQSPAEGLGQRDPNRYASPEGAEQSFSIPHVPLVAGNSAMGEDLFRPFRAGGKIGG
jgi:hypothetical protein